MEFKYCAGQNQRAPSPMPRPFSTVANMNSNIPRHSLQGVFPLNDPVPTILPMSVPVNVDEAFRGELEKQQIRRELENEEIRREIIANQMTLARRRELEEEVMREMAMERALEIPMQRPVGTFVPRGVSMSFDPRRIMIQDNNISSGTKSQVDIRQPYCSRTTYRPNCTDQVIIQAKPDGDDYGAKRKAVTHPAANDNEHPPSNLQKKSKHDWSCALCQVAATSEKQLSDHLQGKKHKARLRSVHEYSEIIRSS